MASHGALHKAFTFQTGFVTIGVGAWLGTIMLFNVWGLIWPNQKKILGLEACDGRREGEGAQGGAVRFAHELHPVRADADVHGRAEPRPALLSRARIERKARPCRVFLLHASTHASADSYYVRRLVSTPLAEDVGSGDLTAQLDPAGRAAGAQ